MSSFLRDVCWLSYSAFGGSQAHLPVFLRRLVTEKSYLSRRELLELYAVAQMVPGPTSTQVLVALAYKVNGLLCACLTLVIWSGPALVAMIGVALAFHYASFFYDVDRLVRFVAPMSVAFVGYAFFVLCRQMAHRRHIKWTIGWAFGVAFFLVTPYLLPLFFLIGGFGLLLLYARGSWRRLSRLIAPRHINVSGRYLSSYIYLGFWSLILLISAYRSSLFSEFYLQGSAVFGGGQVFMPFLLTDYVEHQGYLRAEEFLSAFALMQALPGPVFAFTAYVGTMAMREYGLWMQIGGGLTAAGAFFLPSVFWALAIAPIWIRSRGRLWVQIVLEGIVATSIGFMGAAALRLLLALEVDIGSYLVLLATLLLLLYGRMPYIVIVALGLLAAVLTY